MSKLTRASSEVRSQACPAVARSARCFAGAVEVEEHGFGRARLGVIADASATSLAAFLDANVEPGSRIITDGWSAYPKATRNRYTHQGTSVAASGLQAHEVLPAVHRVFSLVKRWLMGTMQGSVSPEHVQAYFDEWVFRFNRRNARSRGLLFHTLLRQAVAGEPVTYKSLRKAGRTRPAPPPARGARQTPTQPGRGAPRTALAPMVKEYLSGNPLSKDSSNWAGATPGRRATTGSSSRSRGWPVGSVTRTTTRGASCCIARSTGPHELPAVEVNPAQVPRAGYMDLPSVSVSREAVRNTERGFARFRRWRQPPNFRRPSALCLMQAVR